MSLASLRSSSDGGGRFGSGFGSAFSTGVPFGSRSIATGMPSEIARLLKNSWKTRLSAS